LKALMALLMSLKYDVLVGDFVENERRSAQPPTYYA